MAQNIFKIYILKLDHRPFRDKRITTHCALTSRAFGAHEFYYSGIEDIKLNKNIKNIVLKWGGTFNIEFCDKPLNFVKNFKKKGIVVHLTMYGLNISDIVYKIKKNKLCKNILIIVGGPKVSKSYYDLANYNISVTNQPHSEVSALCMFLYLINENILNKNFENSKINIIPNNVYKKVINKK